MTSRDAERRFLGTSLILEIAQKYLRREAHGFYEEVKLAPRWTSPYILKDLCLRDLCFKDLDLMLLEDGENF